ncbi:MAG: hypothetical protein P1P87_01740 [Trueperaceae bacterium]|nr:hypothetical protein [Trueperaceae bacterium]
MALLRDALLEHAATEVRMDQAACHRADGVAQASIRKAFASCEAGEGFGRERPRHEREPAAEA